MILTIGSVNVDHVYRVAKHPMPGETISDIGLQTGLGGKGANQALAACLAGADVHFTGAVGSDGDWCRKRLSDAGIDVSGLITVDAATGHAIILVDDAAENVIVIHPGANRALTEVQITDAIRGAAKGDWLLLQNETNLVPEAAKAAQDVGLNVAYAAAPFDAVTASRMLENIDLLVVNEIEAAQLSDHLERPLDQIDVPGLLITKGAEGAMYLTASGTVAVEAFDVTPIDTTGAGDTFLGVFLAGLDADNQPQTALTRAAAAAALQVTRQGAADAIPTGAEVEQFLDAGAKARNNTP